MSEISDHSIHVGFLKWLAKALRASPHKLLLHKTKRTVVVFTDLVIDVIWEAVLIARARQHATVNLADALDACLHSVTIDIDSTAHQIAQRLLRTPPRHYDPCLRIFLVRYLHKAPVKTSIQAAQFYEVFFVELFVEIWKLAVTQNACLCTAEHVNTFFEEYVYSFT